MGRWGSMFGMSSESSSQLWKWSSCLGGNSSCITLWWSPKSTFGRASYLTCPKITTRGIPVSTTPQKDRSCRNSCYFDVSSPALSGDLGRGTGTRSGTQLKNVRVGCLPPSHPTPAPISRILLHSTINRRWRLHHNLKWYGADDGIYWLNYIILCLIGDSDGHRKHHFWHISSGSLVKCHRQDSKDREKTVSNTE